MSDLVINGIIYCGGSIDLANTTVQISEAAHELAERKAHETGVGSPGAYVESLINRAKRREKARARIERLLIEGLESGPAEPFTPKDWADMRQEAIDRLNLKAETE